MMDKDCPDPDCDGTMRQTEWLKHIPRTVSDATIAEWERDDRYTVFHSGDEFREWARENHMTEYMIGEYFKWFRSAAPDPFPMVMYPADDETDN